MMPNARARRPRLGNAPATSAIAPVTTKAAPTPSTTREANSIGPTVARPHAIEATRNTALPINIERRRPKRSASAPEARRVPVKARLYASMTQAAPATAKPRSFARSGIATTTAVTSNSIRNMPRPRANVMGTIRPSAPGDVRWCMPAVDFGDWKARSRIEDAPTRDGLADPHASLSQSC